MTGPKRKVMKGSPTGYELKHAKHTTSQDFYEEGKEEERERSRAANKVEIESGPGKLKVCSTQPLRDNLDTMRRLLR